MFKILLTGLILLSCHNLFAADTISSYRSCTSVSERTILTSFRSSVNDVYVYTLIINGVPAVYKSSDSNVTREVGSEHITLYKNQKPVFSLRFFGEELIVYQFPLLEENTEANSLLKPQSIEVNCKDFLTSF